MLLKQLLESPKTSSKLLVYDPFRAFDPEELVKEVVGLANADVDGPRNILFGVNAGAVEGTGIVGIPESAMADLKQAHRLLSALIEPVLHLAFIYDRINGKLVGTLEIDGCDFGPYHVGKDFSETLSRGQCWIRESWDLRAVDRAELVKRKKPEPAKQPDKPPENPVIAVGFNSEPECKLLEIAVPDTSNPPFKQERGEVKQPSTLRRVIKDTVNTVTARILRLGQGQRNDAAADGETGLQTDVSEDAGKLMADADNHYFYEETALKLNLCVFNKGTEDIKGASIELGFPRIPDFDVADHLYISPFDKRLSSKVQNRGYPEVECRDEGIFVRSSFSLLAANRPQQAFRCALRLAVGPGMQGRKLAILYRLRGPDKQNLAMGRLKIQFRQACA